MKIHHITKYNVIYLVVLIRERNNDEFGTFSEMKDIPFQSLSLTKILCPDRESGPLFFSFGPISS